VLFTVYPLRAAVAYHRNGKRKTESGSPGPVGPRERRPELPDGTRDAARLVE